MFVFLFFKLSVTLFSILYLSILSLSLWSLIVNFLYCFCVLFYFYAFCNLLCEFSVLCLFTYSLLYTLSKKKKKYLRFKDFLFILCILLCIISREKTEINIHENWTLLTFLKIKIDKPLGSASRILSAAHFHQV